MFRQCSSPGRAALAGWAFGAGWFALALHWITEPFQVDAARHGWMAPFALFLLSSGLALFWAGAFWLARRLSTGALALVPVWAATEMARAYVFTGFPWAAPAQALVGTQAGQGLAYLGPHGVNFCLFGFAWVLSLPLSRPGMAGGLALKAGALASAGIALMNSPGEAPVADTGHYVRLVQPNAAQHLKWQPGHVQRFLDLQMELTARLPEPGKPAPELVIWPETAIAWRLDQAGPVFERIREITDAQVALGILRSDGERLRNALVHLTGSGAQNIYDKHHLVPFGEYLPFAPLAERLGLAALVQTGPGFGAGPGPEVMNFGRLGPGMPLICYEAVFAHDVNAAPERPAFLLQITNDAWFGQFAGPHQHLAQARMRAIEQGLPMLRAANTGISAVIGPRGRILAHLPLGVADTLDAAVPVPLPPTVYSRAGDLPIVLLIGTMVGVLLLFRAGSERALQRQDK